MEKKEVGCRFDFVTPRPSVILKGPELFLPGRETQKSHVQGRWGRRGQTCGPVFARPGPPLLTCSEDGAPDRGRSGDCKLSHTTGADVCDTLRGHVEEREPELPGQGQVLVHTVLQERATVYFSLDGPRGCGHVLSSTLHSFESFTLQAHECLGCRCSRTLSEMAGHLAAGRAGGCGPLSLCQGFCPAWCRGPRAASP